MVWGCLPGHRKVLFHRIQNIVFPHDKEKLPLKWIYEHYSHAKHTSQCVKEWISFNKIEVLKWPDK